jgi:hypothetical protein
MAPAKQITKSSILVITAPSQGKPFLQTHNRATYKNRIQSGRCCFEQAYSSSQQAKAACSLAENPLVILPCTVEHLALTAS